MMVKKTHTHHTQMQILMDVHTHNHIRVHIHTYNNMLSINKQCRPHIYCKLLDLFTQQHTQSHAITATFVGCSNQTGSTKCGVSQLGEESVGGESVGGERIY